MQNPAVRIGVDLGGTKIEALALDRGGNVLFRQRVSTPSGDYAATVRAIAALVDAVDTAVESATPRGTATVGVGIPGTISPATGLVKGSNSVCLIGHPLDKDIAALVKRPVRLANDADCFALSEASDGAGADAGIVFGAILGTGCGSGVVVNKQIVRGPNAITGEWGHNRLPWPQPNETPGPACYCGLLGCTETFLSGPGFANDYGQKIPATEIADRAAAGDADAEAAMRRYISRLARATSAVINLLDPHVIVLGGGLSKLTRLYDEVPPHWDDYVFSDTVVTKLLPPKHGDSGGVRGAAWLWP
jgi:fructokinase